MNQNSLETIKRVKDNFSDFDGKDVMIRGRIATVRRMKGSIFVDLFERGSKIQIRFGGKQSYIPMNGDLLEISGKCFTTDKGEPTIDVKWLKIINTWKSRIGYKRVSASKSGPLFAFLPKSYDQSYFTYAVRNHIRAFLTAKTFLEVQTPILSNNYNGGKSFPVYSSYLNKKIGFNRTTMEDRMQAIIASGHEKIFQIGSIFRSDKEITFLEGYASFVDFKEGKDLFKDLLSYIVGKLLEDGIGSDNPVASIILKKEWVEVDFFEKASNLFGIDSDIIASGGRKMFELLSKKKMFKNKDLSLENAADELANIIANKHEVPIIINGFPVWSSPLYKVDDDNPLKLERARVYIPGQKGGFEVGVQENSYNNFIKRLDQQRSDWKLTPKDERVGDSDLATVLSGGLPPILGFALNPSRILKIWRNDCHIDPYKEFNS